jgi:CRISPR-associated protein Cmr6
MSSRRSALAQLRSGTAQHAGLWLDKYISHVGQASGDDQPKSTLVYEVAGVPEPDSYVPFYHRWERALQEVEARTRYARAIGRLAIGLGAESVLETSITLHRTYGLPYIPGSALKGLASTYAHQRLDDDRWRKGGDAHCIMFGDTTHAGYVTFFDALYVPGSGHERRVLWPDVITVHHPNYYQQSGTNLAPPADWDSPNPVPFLTATGSYLLAVAGPPAWTATALEMLATALRGLGIGAKTSSGYGRMLVTEQAAQSSGQASRRAAAIPPTSSTTPFAPSSEQAPAAPPRPAAPQLPIVGAVFTGKILEIDSGNVFVEVPDFDSEKALGIIRAEQVGGRKYRAGNAARVEVLKQRETKSGRIVLELKPAPKQA